MKLVDCRIDDLKITAYLFDERHPDGGPKCRFFKAFGFHERDWTRLRDALAEHGQTHPVRRATATPYGDKYEVVGPLRTPDGRTPEVVTIWQKASGAGAPVLVTAYPS